MDIVFNTSRELKVSGYYVGGWGGWHVERAQGTNGYHSYYRWTKGRMLGRNSSAVQWRGTQNVHFHGEQYGTLVILKENL